MGTDRTQYCEKPCLCGNGTFVVDCCSADQPFVSAPSWFEFTIKCDSCEQEYVLQDRDNEAVVVRRVDMEERDAQQKVYFAKTTELMQSPEAERFLSAFEDRLASMGTMADQHRLLRYAGVTSNAIQTFRRDVKGPGIRKYFRTHVSHYQLPEILRQLGHGDDPLITTLGELTAAYKQSQQPPEVVATLGCTLTMEAFYKS